MDTIEQLSRERERLRIALEGIMRALHLRTPKAYPDLASWATAMRDSDNHVVRREARATLEALETLRATQREYDDETPI